MQIILEQVKAFLDNSEREFSEEIIEEFGESCKAILRKKESSSSKNPSQGMTLRASNIGRPSCQLQMEKMEVERELDDYSHTMKMFLGHMVEALAIAVMKGAGVGVQDQGKEVRLNVHKTELVGHCDCTIEGKVYDIKSASPYAFSSKFNAPDGFKQLLEDDAFGYIGQGYFYSEAMDKPLGGWIAINKSTGEWTILEPPVVDKPYREKALRDIVDTVKTIETDQPFKRSFEALPEKFNKKFTGRHFLGMQCTYCSFKKECWKEEGLSYAPQPESRAKYPRYYWYVG